VAMFFLTQSDVMETLLYLHRSKGIAVTVFVDEAMDTPIHHKRFGRLLAAGVPVSITRPPDRGKLHLKSAIIDGQRLITGSVNWTETGLGDSFEDLLVINSRPLAQSYLAVLQQKVIPTATPLKISRLPRLPERSERPDWRQLSDSRPRASRRERPFSLPSGTRLWVTPSEEAFAQLIEAIGAARVSIDCVMYLLSHAALAAAVSEAAQRGVRVRIIPDEVSQSGRPRLYLQQIATAGGTIHTKHDSGKSLHLKLAIIDGRHLWRGSANWSNNAEQKNIEDILHFPNAPELCAHYTRFFEEILAMTEDKTALFAPPDQTATIATRDISHPSLPTSSPKANWEELMLPTPAAPAMPFVGAAVEYLPDERYLPVLLRLIRTAKDSLVGTLYLCSWRPDKPGTQPAIESVLIALEQAARRGVYVYLLLETPLAPGDEFELFHTAIAARLRPLGCDIRLNVPGNSLHDKFIVADLCKILVGSHNWSEGALVGDRVRESSLLIVLPQQMPEIIDYVRSRPQLSDMRSPTNWQGEIAAIRNFHALTHQEKKERIASLSQESDGGPIEAKPPADEPQ